MNRNVPDLDNGDTQANAFWDRLAFNGGAGDDTFDSDGFNIFKFPPALASVETVS